MNGRWGRARGLSQPSFRASRYARGRVSSSAGSRSTRVQPQTRLDQLLDDGVRRTEVVVERDLVPEALRQMHPVVLVAGLEAEQDMAAGHQDAVELGEGRRQVLVRDVDDRVEGEDAAQRLVRQVQRGHRAHVEPEPGMRLARQRHHPGRHVHPEHRHAEGVQPGGDVSGTAADVGDGRRTARAHQLREPGDQGQVQRSVAEPVGELFGVRAGDRVVRGLGVMQEIRGFEAHEAGP